MPNPAIQLGPFEVLQQVGRGASGKVWLSTLRQDDMEDQLVAIKVIDQRSSREERQRAAFRREVHAVAALDHPNIVNIFDLGTVSEAAEAASSGELQAGSPYLAMEFLGGGTLKQRARDMRWREIRRCLLTILDALAHSHARGVLHRDIKSGNILQGSRGMTLVDFGLGSELFSDEMDPSLDRVEGTPPYMAPEQFEARWRDFGPWTDLYSLACLTYSLISGKPPFDRNPDFTEMMFSHLHHQPPPLEAPYPVPPGLQNWLYQMLAKHPSQRFQRAADATLALLSLEAVEDLGEQISSNSPGMFGEDNTVAEPAPVSQELFPEVSSDRRLAIRTHLRSEDRASAGNLAVATVAPPLPDDWRQAADRHEADRLHGVGIGLFGLRSVTLIGREEERDRLWSSLGRVRAQGRSQLVVLRGPAGTGKSRLARWLCERAHELGAAHILRAFHSADDGPLDGMGPMVARHFRTTGLERGEALERIRSSLQGYEDIPPGEAEALAELTENADASSSDEENTVMFDRPETWYVLLERLLERMSRDRPVVMWLDDVQWGLDALGFTQQLLDQQSERPCPVLVLMTVREEALLERDVESLWLDGLLAGNRAACLPIDALDTRDRLTLVRGLLGLEGEVAGQVAERTEGNPLFAFQLVGDWVQRGILVPGERGYRLKDGAEVKLPDDLHQVCNQRLGDFLAGRPDSDRQALELAAALGLAVSAEEWLSACEQLETRPNRALVASLVAHSLARWEGKKGDWAFANAMLRESLERVSVEHGRWPDINKRIARMLAQSGSRNQPERLARHLLRAGIIEQALEPLLKSIYLRFRKGEYILAGRLLGQFDHAMDDLGLAPTEQRRGTSLLIKTRIARKTADYPLAKKIAAKAETLARKHGWKALLARVLLEQANWQQDRFEPVKAQELYTDSLELFREIDDRQGQARCLVNFGLSNTYSGNFDTARANLEEAKRLFQRLDDAEGAGLAYEIMAGVELSTGRLDACEREGKQALEVARNGAISSLEGRSLLLLGDLSRIQDKPEHAETLYREALRAFKSIGSGLVQVAEMHVAWALLEQGRFDEARPALERCQEKLRAEGRPHFVAAAHISLLLCAAAEGAWAACEHHLEAAQELLDKTGFIDSTLPKQGEMAAQRMLAAEQLELAQQTYTQCLEWWRRLGQRDRIVEMHAILEQLN